MPSQGLSDPESQEVQRGRAGSHSPMPWGRGEAGDKQLSSDAEKKDASLEELQHVETIAQRWLRTYRELSKLALLSIPLYLTLISGGSN